MTRVDHPSATDRHSCGGSTPCRTGDFHGQSGNLSPNQPECCEEHSASIHTGLRLRNTAQQSRTHPVASGTNPIIGENRAPVPQGRVLDNNGVRNRSWPTMHSCLGHGPSLNSMLRSGQVNGMGLS